MAEKQILRFCRTCGKQLSSSEKEDVCKACQTKPITVRPFRPFVEPAGRMIGGASFVLGAASFITYVVKFVILPLGNPWPGELPIGSFFLTWEVLITAGLLGILAVCVRGGRALGFAGFLFSIITFAHVVEWVHWLTPRV